LVSLMQARRRPLVESSKKPGNVDRRKAFMDVMERLALGVSAVALDGPRGRHHDRDLRPSLPGSSLHRTPRRH
jgi:hypothetical protein